jgi:ATP-dependent helicase/nuclease subunit B
VELEGRIDRLDKNIQGQMRVLDYKSRDVASLRKGQRDPGEDVQLLFYGLLLDPPAQEAGYLSIQRPSDSRNPSAKVATMVPAPAPFAEHVQALQSRLRSDLARIAQGAPLAANGAESVCRRCELRNLCRHGFTVPSSGVEPMGAVHE